MQTQKQGLKQYIGKANHGLETKFKSEKQDEDGQLPA